MKKIAFMLIVQFVIGSSCMAGGPWTQKKGEGFFKVSEWWVEYDQHYNQNGDIVKNAHSNIYNTTVYAEFGITNKLTALLNTIPISNVQGKIIVGDNMNNYRTEVDKVTTMGDTDIALKYQLSQPNNSYPIAATILFGIPTGDNEAGKQNTLQTGDGEFNILTRLDAGKSFKLNQTINAYATTHVGFNKRSNDYSDEFRFGIEAGVSLLKSKLWIISRVNAVESLKNGSRNDNEGRSFIYANNTEYVGLAFEGSYSINNTFGISAELAGAFRAENVAAAPSYSVGIYYQFKPSK